MSLRSMWRSLLGRPDPFAGTVALVTGAASGIGRALAVDLARRGAAHVVVTDRDGPGAEKVAAEVRALRGGAADSASARTLDVTDAAAVKAAVDATVAAHGRIDVMINNAGIAILGLVSDLSLEHWRKIVDVNLFGVVHGVQAALPHMLARGAGRIISVSSLAGLGPFPSFGAYCATKHGVVGLTRCLDGEVGALGIQVCAVCPGFVQTPLIDRNAVSVSADLGDMQKLNPAALMSAEACARGALDGAADGDLIVVMPRAARVLERLMRWCPPFGRALNRAISAKYRSLKKVPAPAAPAPAAS